MNRLIYDGTGKRRVSIFQRSDGSFTFIEEHFSDNPLEQSWLPQTHGRSLPLCDSFETATNEALARIKWLGESLEKP